MRGNGQESTISYTRYQYTLINSFGFCQTHDESQAERYWSECERYYGIDHHGETTPCPLRKLAFLILKGDPMALDTARDILKC